MLKKFVKIGALVALVTCVQTVIAGPEQVELADCRIPTQVMFAGEPKFLWSGMVSPVTRYVQQKNGTWETKHKNPQQSNSQGPSHAQNYTSVNCGPERYGQKQWITATVVFEEKALEVLDHFAILGQARVPTNLDYALCPRYDARGIILWGSGTGNANKIQPERFVSDYSSAVPRPGCPNQLTYPGALGGFGNAKFINDRLGSQQQLEGMLAANPGNSTIKAQLNNLKVLQTFKAGTEYKLVMYVYPTGVQYQITDPGLANTSDRWLMRNDPWAAYQTIFDESTAQTSGTGFSVAVICKPTAKVKQDCDYVNPNDYANPPFRIRFKDIQMGWW